MKRQLIVVLVAMGLIAGACGSGGDAEPRGTETSERAARQATVEEQEAASQDLGTVSESGASEEAEQAPAQGGDGEEQGGDVEQQEAAIEEEEDPAERQQQEAAVELPAKIVGVHKGVRSEGRLLGDPDAPVLIEHFGDFT